MHRLYHVLEHVGQRQVVAVGGAEVQDVHRALDGAADDKALDPGKDFEEEEFLRRAKSRYGNKGQREAEAILKRAGALFAGGALDDDAKEVFMQSLMQIYMESKEEASEKFSPKKK